MINSRSFRRREPVGVSVRTASVALLVAMLAAHGARAQSGVPFAERTYILPLSTVGQIPGDVAGLKASLPDGKYTKAGFTVYISIELPAWTVSPSDPAAIRLALKPTFDRIDEAVNKGVQHNVPLALYFLSAIRESTDAFERAAELEDGRNVQWYADNTLAAGWMSHSRYARKQRELQKAYVTEVGRYVAAKMALHPEIVVAATGDGEIELSFHKSSVGCPATGDLAAICNGVRYTPQTSLLADYSPFAIAEFRDWLTRRGLYSTPEGIAQAYEFSSRYANDPDPATDAPNGGDGNTLNKDFGTDFTTWSLRLEDWSLTDVTDVLALDPKRIPTLNGALARAVTLSNAKGFDAPRTFQSGDKWWELWHLFRQFMLLRYNQDFAKWMTTAIADGNHTIPAERWYSSQISSDYVFGHSPTNRDFRFITSASSHWTGDVSPYGGMGVTGFNHNWNTDDGGGPYAKTLENLAPVLFARLAGAPSDRVRRWAVTEWNPSVPTSSSLTVYRDENKLLRRFRPTLLVPLTWIDTGNAGKYTIKGTAFETGLQELMSLLDTPASCRFATSVTSIQAGAGKVTAALGIATSAGQGTSISECGAAPADSPDSWITLASEPGGVVYTLAANPSATARTGTILIGASVVTVTQAAVTLAWDKTSLSMTAGVNETLPSATATLTVGGGSAPLDIKIEEGANCGFLTFTTQSSGAGAIVTITPVAGQFPFTDLQQTMTCHLLATTTASPNYARLPVTLVVKPRPTLAWTNSAIDLTANLGRPIIGQAATLSSTGGDADWTLTLSDGCGFLSFTPSSGRGTKPVTVTADPTKFPFLPTEQIMICTLTASSPHSNNASLVVKLTVAPLPKLEWNRTVLDFTAVNKGTSITAQQTVILNAVGGAPQWTSALSANCPFFSYTPTASTGGREVVVSVVPGSFPTLPNTYVNECTLTATSPNSTTAPQLKLRLTVKADALSALPIGQVDTPTQNASNLVGAIGVTGWAIDDVGIKHVKIYRNCLDFDAPASCQTVGGQSVVLIGTAAFLEDARPDVALAYPGYPDAAKAGWGFAVMTSMLPHIPNKAPNGGQGALTISVFATDVEGNVRMLGRTHDGPVSPTFITLGNDTIGKPFGAIDTPGQGETLRGVVPNFGWALTPDSNATAGDAGDILIPTDGSTSFVFIDGIPRAPVTYNQCRGTVGNPPPATVFCNDDVANIFGNAVPQPVFTERTKNETRHRNLDAGRGAIGSYLIDTRMLTDGLHTIAWSVRDSADRTEGIGSRFFRVSNQTATDPAPVARFSRASADMTLDSTTVSRADVRGRSGFDLDAPRTLLAIDADGLRRVRIRELGRLELELPDGFVEGFHRVNGQLKPLPVGASMQDGIFGWAPPAGYFGRYELVFADGSEQLLVEVTVDPAGGETGIEAFIDGPANGSVVSGDLVIGGWARDREALSGAGIGTAHVWAFPRTGGNAAPVFLGAAEMGGARPDVAAVHGQQLAASGWSLRAAALPAGDYEIVVYFWSIRTGNFADARSVKVTVR